MSLLDEMIVITVIGLMNKDGIITSEISIFVRDEDFSSNNIVSNSDLYVSVYTYGDEFDSSEITRVLMSYYLKH